MEARTLMQERTKVTADNIRDKAWALVQEAELFPFTIRAARGWILQATKWALRYEQHELAEHLSGCMLRLADIRTCYND